MSELQPPTIRGLPRRAIGSTPTRMTIRQALLDWYDANQRDLPWRHTRDPYAIWVSEVMLQQTRVETVIPYWERFLARFPTPAALAAATEDEVLGLWSGLGYYRRARLLHRGVREVVARYGGEVPEDRDARLALPGVGKYTAGAIGSIAFDRAEPIVDGNVARVLSRVHRIETPLGVAQTEQRLWEEAAALAEGPRPGALNQALMELGATVCTPRAPRCEACPVRSACAGRDVAERLPVPRKKAAPKEVSVAAVVVRSGGRVWLARGQSALYGGLWSVPMCEHAPAQASLLERHEGLPADEAARSALAEVGIVARLGAVAGELEHVLTHRRMRVRVYRASHARAEAHESLRSVDPSELEEGEIGVSKLTRRILAIGVS
ncbi:MAG: A/G-specific adenine glycosylase [Myxococcales bacterium]|nr:A/G-specific adenine glycosylase [Myxococcales bacterium]